MRRNRDDSHGKITRKTRGSRASHPNAVMPWANRNGFQDDEGEEWVGSTADDRRGVAGEQERKTGIKLKIAGQSAPLPSGARILGGSGGCGGGGGCGCG